MLVPLERLTGRLRGSLSSSRIARRAAAAARRRRFVPPPGKVRFGDLDGTGPLGWAWGFDRGGAVDRVYIERFLGRHAEDVRGRVLEVGDDTYTRRFGGDRVDRSDVLHVDPDHPHATMSGDLVDGSFLPTDAFDCIVLTQTLQYVTDPAAALRSIDRALNARGVLLLTVPGISVPEIDAYGGAWGYTFTANAMRRLVLENLTDVDVEIDSHGNALVATAFVQGLGVDDLAPDCFDEHEPTHAVVHTIRAVRRSPRAPVQTG